MIDDVKKQNEKYGCLLFLYKLLTMAATTFAFILVMCICARFKYPDSPAVIHYFAWIGAVIFITPVVIIEINKKKKANSEPYFISIKSITFDELIEEVSKSFKLHQIERGWYFYGDAWFGSKVMCIFSNMHQYSADSLASTQDTLYERAWEDCGLKKRISMGDAKDLIIIYVNTVDSDSDALKKVIYKNAASAGLFGNVFDAYVVLSEGVVYIPRAKSADFPAGAYFNNAVIFISDLFEELEDI